MKISIFIFFLNLFICSKVLAASYLSVGMGTSSYESDILSSELKMDKKRLIGDLISFHFGHFLTNALSFELGFLESELEEYSLGPTNDWTQNANLTAYTIGFRYFSYEFLNLLMGMSKMKYSSQVKKSSSLDAFEIEDDEQIAPYYGLGLGLTFQKWQIFYDTRVFSLSGRDNFNIYNWGIRVFF